MIARDTVQAGEDIVRLAGRLLNDPYAWDTLVRLNKLKAPYTSDTPRAGCLSPGDTVLYPARQMPVAQVSAATLEARTYLRDLRDDGRGDLVLSGINLTTTVGMENLKVALLRRVRTRLGRHPFHPLYGSLLSQIVGRPSDVLILRLACNDAKRAIMRDPRVESCSVRVVWEYDIARFACDIQPIAPGQALRIIV